MSDVNIVSQAQLAYQNTQAQAKLSAPKDTAGNGNNNFAALTAQQMKDPSFTQAMNRKKIKETAIEFEAQFLSQMLQPMFEGITPEEPFGGGMAEEMWQSMLVKEYGTAIANNGGIGLADHVQKQLLRAQEGLE